MIQRPGGVGVGAWLSLLDHVFLCLDLPRCASKGAKSPMKSPAHLPSKHTRKPRTTEPSSFAGGVDAYTAAGGAGGVTAKVKANGVPELPTSISPPACPWSVTG